MKQQSLIAGVLASVLAACSSFGGAKKPEIRAVERLSSGPAIEPEEGEALARAGRTEAAVASYRATLAADPFNHAARYGLAEALRDLGEYDEAKAEYAKLAQNDAWRARAAEGVGLASLATDDRNAAFEALAAAVELDSALWRAHVGLAQLSDLGRHWEKSDASYAAAIKSTDRPAIVENNRGISLLARGDAKGAADAFTKSLAAEPSFERARINLDLANAADGRSIAELAKAETDPKKRAQLLNNYGYVAMLQGRLDDAEDYLNAALEASPSFYKAAFENLNVLKAMKKSEARK